MILSIVMLLLTIGIMRSQVTIGSLEPPSSGSLLDLKETSEGASTRGLLLPRVSLESTTLPLPTTTNHVPGMFVYNTATVNDVTPGIYYDDGSKWNRLYPDKTTANNGLTMSGDAVQLGGALTKATQIDNGANTLEITGTTGTTTISSPLAISSGAPDAGKVLKSGDASGNAYWDNIVPTANKGSMDFGGANVTIHSAPNGSGYSYTKYHVDCPPGRSMIYAAFNLRNTSKYGGYVTVGLSTNATTNTYFADNTNDPNLQGYTPKLSGFALLPNLNIDAGSGSYTASLGVSMFYVNNTSTGNIPLYLWAMTQGSSPTVANPALDNAVVISYQANENFILCAY